MFGQGMTSRAMLAGLALLVVGLAGCATGVKQADLDDQLARLRQELQDEMQQGDQRVATESSERNAALQVRLAELELVFEAFGEELAEKSSEMLGLVRFEFPVYFDFDAAVLDDEDRAVLNRFAEVVSDFYPASLITVEGFADPAGSEEYNLHLAGLRAATVVEYLIENTMLDDEFVRVVAYGEAENRQVAPGETGPGEAGWQNRRVVLVIDYVGATGG